MKTARLSPSSEAAIWLQILYPDGELSSATAQTLLKLALPTKEKARLRELSAKARAGILTEKENAMMEQYERAGALLSILKSKARHVLKAQSPEA